VLRPRSGRLLYGLVLATMFVPAVVLLVPLYLTVLDLPFTHWNLVNTVLPDPAKQPLSVRLPRLAGVTELDVLLAALLISCALPIAFFLVFQRLFLRGGLEGAVKG
jgi:ABC-type glycerol-3-phosphate transport system permease component